MTTMRSPTLYSHCLVLVAEASTHQKSGVPILKLTLGTLDQRPAFQLHCIISIVHRGTSDWRVVRLMQSAGCDLSTRSARQLADALCGRSVYVRYSYAPYANSVAPVVHDFLTRAEFDNR